MQKIPGELRRQLPCATLHLDDVEKVYEVLSALGKNAPIRIEADGYATDDPTELDQLPNNRVRNLLLSRPHPHIAVRLGPSESQTYVYANSDDALSRGAVEQTVDIITARKRCLPFTTVGWSGRILTVISVAAGGSLLASWGTSPMKGLLGACFITASAGIAAMGCYTEIFNYSVVIPKRRRDTPSFLERNKDPILVAIVSSVIGLALGIVATLATQYLATALRTSTP